MFHCGVVQRSIAIAVYLGAKVVTRGAKSDKIGLDAIWCQVLSTTDIEHIDP